MTDTALTGKASIDWDHLDADDHENGLGVAVDPPETDHHGDGTAQHVAKGNGLTLVQPIASRFEMAEGDRRWEQET